MNKLYVVGIGPGDLRSLSEAARMALLSADLLCGYTVYIDLVRPLCPGTPVLTTAMTEEITRCRMALAAAEEGRTVAMVCSGDAGIYGMAGPILELAPDYPHVSVEVIPGITAASSGAALLGAPLMQDFAVLSLSDRLIPWEKIERRLAAAAEAELVLCLYNPASHRRKDHLRWACDRLLTLLPPETVCGWVRRVGREGEAHGVLTLAELRDFPADMFTTVFVGTRETRLVDGRMVTPRGYPL